MTAVRAPAGERRNVAVCVVGDDELDVLAAHPRVLLSGTLATANLGIEHLILGCLARPAVRHLMLVGRDSALFRPAQSLLALARNGVDAASRIVGAEGFRPTLPTLRPDVVNEFRRQVAVHDLLECRSVEALTRCIDNLPVTATREPELGDDLGLAHGRDWLHDTLPQPDDRLRPLTPRGRRVPAGLTGHGYFMIAVDAERGELVLRHYCEDLTAGHVIRGHCPERLVLSVIEHGLVDDCAHAAYLGAELAKADTARRAGVTYVQDRPVRLPRRRHADRVSAVRPAEHRPSDPVRIPSEAS